MGQMLASVGLVVATTLAGSRPGVDRANCSTGEWFAECAVLDSSVAPDDLKLPWVVLLGAFLVCGLPTLFCRCRDQADGVLTLCVAALGSVCLMLCQDSVPHKSVAYAVALHGSAAVLGSVPVGPWFPYPEVWRLRYLAVWVLLFVGLKGPSLAVVQWPGSPGSVTCAAQAHLIGALGSDLVVRSLWWASGWAGEMLAWDR